MISHNFPKWDTSLLDAIRRPGCLRVFGKRPQSISGCVRSAWSAAYGSLRGEFHAAARLQGTRLDAGFVSFGARPRRFRWPLLLSGTGSPCDRRRRKCTDAGDRGLDWALCAIFGPARAIRPGALRYQRDAEDRRRGAGGVEREPQASCRNYRGGGVCWSRSQVSNLGARQVPERARGGHPKGARAQRGAEFPGGGAQRARSTGMMAGSGGSAVAGGPALHIPVLGRPAVDFLKVCDGGVYIDGTFGAGGYTRAILEAADCKVIGIDRDQRAIALGADLVEQANGRLTLIEDRFSNLAAIARDAGYDAVDGVVLDLGVSSMQLDAAGRGFSFRLDGPLDMRMSGEGATAADIVSTAGE